MNKFKFSLSKDIELDLILDEGIFTPTGTTNLLVDSVSKQLSGTSSKSILDLGSGCGVVAISLCKLHQKSKNIFFASDISDNVVDCILLNADNNNCNCYINVRNGSLFEPWSDYKFDIIVDDISGVSEEVAKVSDWFNGISCDSGIGGDILTNKVIKESKKYLKDGGEFFFPLISFSDVKNILKTANKYYNKVECVGRKEWLLPDAMKYDVPLLKKLKNRGYVDFEERFGTIIWYTEIYKAY